MRFFGSIIVAASVLLSATFTLAAPPISRGDNYIVKDVHDNRCCLSDAESENLIDLYLKFYSGQTTLVDKIADPKIVLYDETQNENKNASTPYASGLSEFANTATGTFVDRMANDFSFHDCSHIALRWVVHGKVKQRNPPFITAQEGTTFTFKGTDLMETTCDKKIAKITTSQDADVLYSALKMDVCAANDCGFGHTSYNIGKRRAPGLRNRFAKAVPVDF